MFSYTFIEIQMPVTNDVFTAWALAPPYDGDVSGDGDGDGDEVCFCPRSGEIENDHDSSASYDASHRRELRAVAYFARQAFSSSTRRKMCKILENKMR